MWWCPQPGSPRTILGACHPPFLILPLLLEGRGPGLNPRTWTGEHPAPLSGPPLLSCLPDPRKGNPGTPEAVSLFPRSLLVESHQCARSADRALPASCRLSSPTWALGKPAVTFGVDNPALQTRAPQCGASSRGYYHRALPGERPAERCGEEVAGHMQHSQETGQQLARGLENWVACSGLKQHRSVLPPAPSPPRKVFHSQSKIPKGLSFPHCLHFGHVRGPLWLWSNHRLREKHASSRCCENEIQVSCCPLWDLCAFFKKKQTWRRAFIQPTYFAAFS